MKEQW